MNIEDATRLISRFANTVQLTRVGAELRGRVTFGQLTHNIPGPSLLMVGTEVAIEVFETNPDGKNWDLFWLEDARLEVLSALTLKVLAAEEHLRPWLSAMQFDEQTFGRDETINEPDERIPPPYPASYPIGRVGLFQYFQTRVSSETYYPRASVGKPLLSHFVVENAHPKATPEVIATNSYKTCDDHLSLTSRMAYARVEAFKQTNNGSLSKSRTYIVESGDTLSELAERFYGNVAFYPLIAAANHLADANYIVPGQILEIPRPYPVHSGEDD